MNIVKTNVAFLYQNTVLALPYSIEPAPQSSYSSILTLANYMSSNFPHITPPDFSINQKVILNQNQSQTLESIPMDKYFQPWCDFLTQIMRKNSAFLHQKTLYFLIELKSEELIRKIKINDNSNIFNEMKIQHMGKQTKLQKKLEKIFSIKIQNATHKKKHFAIMNLSTSSLRTDPYYPKVHLDGLIQGIWFNNQDWKVFKILKGQVPSSQQIQKFDGIILTGSSLSVNDNNQQVNKMICNIKKALNSNNKLNVLGICFGHQAITKMFGGKVQKQNWIGGVQDVQIQTEIINKFPFFEPLHESKHMKYGVSEFHSDFVTKIPDNFQKIASSSSCHIQGQISQDGRVLSFQFHPEYISPYVKAYQKRITAYNGKALFGQFEYSQQFHEYHKNSVMIWRKVIANFLNH